MTVWATRADQVDLRGPNPHDLARSPSFPQHDGAPSSADVRRPTMICEAGESGWSREHVQVQVEVAAGEALDLGDTEGVAVEVPDIGVHADAVALVRGAVDHDLHWHSLAVRRQGSVEQPTGTLLPQAVGSEGDVGVGGGIQQRCGPHLVVPLGQVEAATGSATSSSLEAIVNVAFTAPRPNIWRPEYVTVERWGSTRYIPAAGTASDGASPTAITASLRLVLPAKLLDGAPRLIERAGKSSLVQRSPAMSSGASAPYSPALVWHLRPRLCPGPQPAQISVGRRTMIRTPGTPGASAAMSSGSEDTTTAASLAAQTATT